MEEIIQLAKLLDLEGFTIGDNLELLQHYSERITYLLGGWVNDYGYKVVRKEDIKASILFFSLFREEFKNRYGKMPPFFLLMSSDDDELTFELINNDYRIAISLTSNEGELAGVYAINFVTKKRICLDFPNNIIPHELIEWMGEIE